MNDFHNLCRSGWKHHTITADSNVGSLGRSNAFQHTKLFIFSTTVRVFRNSNTFIICVCVLRLIGIDWIMFVLTWLDV